MDDSTGSGGGAFDPPEGLLPALEDIIVSEALSDSERYVLRQAIAEGAGSLYWRRAPHRAVWLFDLLDGPTGPKVREFARDALWNLCEGDLFTLLTLIHPVQVPDLAGILEGRTALGARSAEACLRLAAWAADGVTGAVEALIGVGMVSPGSLVTAVVASEPDEQAEMLRVWKLLTMRGWRMVWPSDWSKLVASPSPAVRWLVMRQMPQEEALLCLDVLRYLRECDPEPAVAKLARLLVESLETDAGEPLWPPEPLWVTESHCPEVEASKVTCAGRWG